MKSIYEKFYQLFLSTNLKRMITIISTLSLVVFISIFLNGGGTRRVY